MSGRGQPFDPGLDGKHLPVKGWPASAAGAKPLVAVVMKSWV